MFLQLLPARPISSIGDKVAVAAICQKLLEIVRKMDDREYSGK
jgi:hypothetical protein|tara:strand:- start:432 stop:560 length:129 start_codon:yes stop_codon:yes gene_type:complete